MKTKTVEHMIDHTLRMKTFDLRAYKDIVSIWKQCAMNKSEPILDDLTAALTRDTYYPGWTDEDFKRALDGIGEG